MIEKKKIFQLILNILLIAGFLTLIVFASIKYLPMVTELAKKPQLFRDTLNSYGWEGVFLFIGIQALQVIVAAIPGEIIQLAGGYIFGTWLGTLYSITGILIGTIIVFYIAKALGFSIVKMFVSKKNLEKFNFLMNSNKTEVTTFILFVIPGIPKDILTYIAGLTPIKPMKFFIIITIARLPALFASSYIGSNTQKGNYLEVTIISVVALIIFAIGILMKDKILAKINKAGN